MPVINSPSDFFLLLSGGVRMAIKKGAQTVDAEIASHPYIKAVCGVVEDAVEAVVDTAENIGDHIEAVVDADQTFDGLAAKASNLGIKVDGRWGLERLKAEIAGKEAAAADDPEDDKTAEAALEAAKVAEGDIVTDTNASEQVAS